MSDRDVGNAIRTLITHGFEGIDDKLLNHFIVEAIKAGRSEILQSMANRAGEHKKTYDEWDGSSIGMARTLADWGAGLAVNIIGDLGNFGVVPEIDDEEDLCINGIHLIKNCDCVCEDCGQHISQCDCDEEFCEECGSLLSACEC